jgi:hypothetical protein
MNWEMISAVGQMRLRGARKTGTNPAGVYELARRQSRRLSAPLSPAQSLLPKISFETTNAAVGGGHQGSSQLATK